MFGGLKAEMSWRMRVEKLGCARIVCLCFLGGGGDFGLFAPLPEPMPLLLPAPTRLLPACLVARYMVRSTSTSDCPCLFTSHHRTCFGSAWSCIFCFIGSCIA